MDSASIGTKIWRVIGASLILAWILVACSGGPTENPNACEVHSHEASHTVDLDETLYHSPSVYTVRLRLGDQEIDFVADTGSADLIVRGGRELCPSCSGSDRERYSPGASQPAGAAFEASYGSGSASVRKYSDAVGLACGDPVSDYSFGVITEDRGVPNVLGLAYPPLAHDGLEPFWGQLVSRHGLVDEFSMLLCGRRTGSHVTFGGRDSRRAADSDYRWVKIVEERYYAIEALSLKMAQGSFVNGEIELPFEGSNTTIIDSGTTLSRLPGEMVSQVVAEMEKTVAAAGLEVPAGFWTATDSTDPAYKHSFSPADLAHFPTLQVVLRDTAGAPAAFSIAPETYLKALYQEEDQRVFGFRPASGLTILGQVFMENGLFVFDRAKGRVGIAANDELCS